MGREFPKPLSPLGKRSCFSRYVKTNELTRQNQDMNMVSGQALKTAAMRCLLYGYRHCRRPSNASGNFGLSRGPGEGLWGSLAVWLAGPGCFPGASRGAPGRSWGPPGGLPGPPGGVLGGSGGLPGASWGGLGAVWGLLGGSGGLLGASWVGLGASWRLSGGVWRLPGGLPGRVWGPPGASWGPPGGLLGAQAGPLERILADLKPSQAVFRLLYLETLKIHSRFDGSVIFGPRRGSSWAS